MFLPLQILTLLVVMYMCPDPVASQNLSAMSTECINTATCPCCSVPCPSDGTGQCGGKCNDGYHGGKCWNICPYNCIRCVDAQQGGGVSNCTLCRDGYYSTTTLYQCQSKCPNNCMNCKSNTTCTVCKDGYYSTPDQYQCQSNCSSNCKTCNATYCHECNEGYYLSNSNQCSKCKNNCTSCISESICTGCVVGYYLDQENGMCQKCNSLCSSCNSSNTCTCSNGCAAQINVETRCVNESDLCSYGCKSNFSSNSINFTLSQHKETCDKCIDGNYGVHCDFNCSLNCKPGVCDRISGRCKNCIQSFYGDHCELYCPKNCNSCNKTSGFCDSCIIGFYGINCTEMCPINCTQCVSSETCSVCIVGFYGDRCEKTCPINCKEKTCHKNNGTCFCIPGYSGILCDYLNVSTTEALPPLGRILPEDNSKHVGPTVGGTLAGAAIITALVVVAVIIYRRRRAFRYARHDIDFDSYKLDARLIDVLEENDEFDPTYFTGKVDDKKKRCGKLPVKDLARFIDTHGEEFYQEEFLKLPRGLIKPCEDAKKEENVVKNRYTGIYPYDEHRVRLQPPGSDFINACFMDGLNRKNEYIASLGPTRKAMEGFHLFWRMVWQEKTDVIVMVTNLMEGQSMKCEQYWPDLGSSTNYGEIMVTSQTEDVYAEFVVRSLTVTKGREERKLHHFHYTAWPDKRVPDDVTSLIEFRQKVKATGSKLGGPTVVHCSAGIGRTGTYIALDILIHQGKTQKSLDIFEWVTRMREQRTSMVQTWPQYEYLHRALLHALTYHCEPVKLSKIERFMDSLNDRKNTKMFKQLDKQQEKSTESEQEAREMNKGLEGMNRSGADIPGSMNRPFLHLDKKFGENNYINALFLNSYTVKNRFLVCQTPLPDTVKDFLTLIIQESCCCIVSMDPPGLKDQTVGAYYPVRAGTVYTHPSYVFDVEAQDLDTNPSYNLRRLVINFNKRVPCGHSCFNYVANVITYQRKRQRLGMYLLKSGFFALLTLEKPLRNCESGTTSRTVYHFQCQHWPQGNRVPDVSHFLQLIQDVDNMADRDSDRGPILVHCLNAAERSVLYCVVSNLAQKMRVEGEVSVVNTLRQAKVRRPIAIPNKEQYMFCYRCVHQFVKSQNDTNEEAVYGNID